jgi:hypothetical protein
MSQETWIALVVADADRFREVTGCAAREGELYRVAPLHSRETQIAEERGLAAVGLVEYPDAGRVRWNEARREFEAKWLPVRLWRRLARAVRRG